MENKEKKSIKENILEGIKTGRIKMRPRWHFILKAVLALSGGFITLLFLLYLASLIIFVLHQNGVWFVPIFGLLGIRVFLFSFPWLLLLMASVFIIVLEILVRRFSFGFRRPLLFSLAIIIFAVLLGGFAVAKTSLHHGLFRQTRENRLPGGKFFYTRLGVKNFRNVHRGTVSEVQKDGFMFVNNNGEFLKVFVGPKTRFPLGADFSENDLVVIFGERDGDSVKALGVRRIDDVFEERFHGPRMMRFQGPPMMRQ